MGWRGRAQSSVPDWRFLFIFSTPRGWEGTAVEQASGWRDLGGTWEAETLLLWFPRAEPHHVRAADPNPNLPGFRHHVPL